MAVEEEEIRAWLFELFLRREALADFEKPMLDLASLCRSRDEFELIMHTVEKLVALSQPQFAKQIQSMATHIRASILDDRPLAIVATAWGSAPDSSQQLVQLLKPLFRREKNVRFFNSVNAYEKKDHIANCPRFVLVDEFSGTGRTIASRIEHISKLAKSKGIEVEPFVCLLFGMELALESLMKKEINAHFCTALKAGISGYFEGGERESRIAWMQRLEKELAEDIDGSPLPSLGHGQAEALFFIKDMNAPNSNFPIFWWPIDASGNDRDTVMHRAEL